jgi:hypothetical protein
MLKTKEDAGRGVFVLPPAQPPGFVLLVAAIQLLRKTVIASNVFLLFH